MGKPMSTNVEAEKQEIRNQLRDFFRKNMIEIDDDPDYIGVQGFLSGLEVSTEISISVSLGEKRYLFIDIEKDNINIIFKKSFEKNNADVLKISRSGLIRVYYFNNTLFFCF